MNVWTVRLFVFRFMVVDFFQAHLFSARFVLVILAIFCVPIFSSAYYSEPPHALVAQHNAALAGALSGVFLPISGGRPQDAPLGSFRITANALFPSVDQVVSSAHPPSVLWGWSYEAQPEYPWDRPLSGCNSNHSKMSLAGVQSRFYLHSNAGSQHKVFPDPSNPAPIGFTSSELSILTVPLQIWLEGSLVLTYRQDVETLRCQSFCTWAGCTVTTWVEKAQKQPSYSYGASSAPISASIQVPSNQSVFLNPWISNFSVFLPDLRAYLYANTSLYVLESRLDGVLKGQRHVSDFDIRPDGVGAWSVVSVAHDYAWSDPALPADVDSAFSKNYRGAYRVVQTLNGTASVGLHHWSLHAWDYFGDPVEFSSDVTGHDAASITLAVNPAVVEPNAPVDLAEFLTRRSGDPVLGETLVIESAGSSLRVVTDSSGRTHAPLSFDRPGTYRILVRYGGSASLAPVFADALVTVRPASADVGVPLRHYDFLLLGLVLLLSLAMVRIR